MSSRPSGDDSLTGEWTITRLHNAMTLIEVDSTVLLTDPWFASSRAFRGSSPVSVRELPAIDAIIGSHWVRDHWGMREMSHYRHKATPVYVSADNMADAARSAGFTHVEVLDWGDRRAVSDSVTLHALEEHVGRGRRTNNYGIVGPTARVFFGGEVLSLDAIARIASSHEPFDVAVGPVNGVRLLGRQLTVTAAEMLEATRRLGAPRLVAIHDEHRSLRPLLKVESSIRDLDDIDHPDVEVIELAFGECFAAGG